MESHARDGTHWGKVDRAVARIAADPLSPPRLETLAADAGLSPFHYHRIYAQITGETVNETIRRARLAHAAHLLATGADRVTDIALLVGYESPQAFTRAFADFAGQSPNAFRRQLQAPLELQIVERPPQPVHALLHEGSHATISHTHRRLARRIRRRTARQWLGVAHGGPAQFRYYAAVVCDDVPPDLDLVRLELPAGLYAHHRVAGPYSRINPTFQAIYRHWLPASACEAEPWPVIEHFVTHPRESQPPTTDLYLPIRPVCSP
jgi:AraC family transcriptional regulator